MALFRDLDGNLYEIPDDQLANFRVKGKVSKKAKLSGEEVAPEEGTAAGAVGALRNPPPSPAPTGSHYIWQGQAPAGSRYIWTSSPTTSGSHYIWASSQGATGAAQYIWGEPPTGGTPQYIWPGASAGGTGPGAPGIASQYIWPAREGDEGSGNE